MGVLRLSMVVVIVVIVNIVINWGCWMYLSYNNIDWSLPLIIILLWVVLEGWVFDGFYHWWWRMVSPEMDELVEVYSILIAKREADGLWWILADPPWLKGSVSNDLIFFMLGCQYQCLRVFLILHKIKNYKNSTSMLLIDPGWDSTVFRLGNPWFVLWQFMNIEDNYFFS